MQVPRGRGAAGVFIHEVAHIVIGRVVGVHIRDDVIAADGKLDVLKIRPLARLGYHDYTTDRVDLHDCAERSECGNPPEGTGRTPAPSRPFGLRGGTTDITAQVSFGSISTIPAMSAVGPLFP